MNGYNDISLTLLANGDNIGFQVVNKVLIVKYIYIYIYVHKCLHPIENTE